MSVYSYRFSQMCPQQRTWTSFPVDYLMGVSNLEKEADAEVQEPRLTPEEFVVLIGILETSLRRTVLAEGVRNDPCCGKRRK